MGKPGLELAASVSVIYTRMTEVAESQVNDEEATLAPRCPDLWSRIPQGAVILMVAGVWVLLRLSQHLCSLQCGKDAGQEGEEDRRAQSHSSQPSLSQLRLISLLRQPSHLVMNLEGSGLCNCEKGLASCQFSQRAELNSHLPVPESKTCVLPSKPNCIQHISFYPVSLL